MFRTHGRQMININKRIAVILAAISLVTMVLLQGRPSVYGLLASDPQRYTFQEPFALKGEKGVGPNPVEGMLLLRAQDEKPFVSRVLLETIQELQLSLPIHSSN